MIRRVHIAPEKRLEAIPALDTGSLDECCDDVMRTGGDGHAQAKARVEGFRNLLRVFGQDGKIGGAAHWYQVHSLAVDGQLELLWVFEAAHRSKDRLQQLDFDQVVASQRQRDARTKTAAGAERQAFDVLGLRGVRRDMIGARVAKQRPVAYR